MKYGFHSKLAALSQDAYFFAVWNASKGREKSSSFRGKYSTTEKTQNNEKECNKFLKQFQKVPLKENI